MKFKLSPEASHALSSLREFIAGHLAAFTDSQAKFEAAEAKFASLREERLGERNAARQLQLETELELARRDYESARREVADAKTTLQGAIQRAANILRASLQDTFAARRKAAAKAFESYFEHPLRALPAVDSTDWHRVWQNQLAGYWAASGGTEMARQVLEWIDAFLEGQDPWFHPKPE